jgi:ferredoxin--NADP+ reductase
MFRGLLPGAESPRATSDRIRVPRAGDVGPGAQVPNALVTFGPPFRAIRRYSSRTRCTSITLRKLHSECFTLHRVLSNERLSPNVYRLVIEAPRIAQIRQPGQFVIVHLGPGAERIPLTIADVDAEAGTISLVIQGIGKSTMDLVELLSGAEIDGVAGPLGKPTELPDDGHAVCVGGGVGTAVILPIAQALRRRGVHVTSIIGGRSREWVILEPELAACGDVITCTDDGSYGRAGFVTQALADVLAAGGVDEVFAVGPVPMMRAVVALTKPIDVKTTVSLNPIMVDGTGMCGGCRVSVDGETRYACVEGPEFDGLRVDFDELADRQATYRPFEKAALEQRQACKVGLRTEALPATAPAATVPAAVGAGTGARS